MKAVFNNLIYDTNKSTLINTHYESDRGFIRYNSRTEYLYITENNRFFLHIHEINLVFLSYGTDDYIMPLSENQAFNYMVNYCPSKISKYFKLEDA